MPSMDLGGPIMDLGTSIIVGNHELKSSWVLLFGGDLKGNLLVLDYQISAKNIVSSQPQYHGHHKLAGLWLAMRDSHP